MTAQIVFTYPHRVVHCEDRPLSSGTAAWMQIREFNTAISNTCTSAAAAERARHESVILLYKCVFAPVCHWHL